MKAAETKASKLFDSGQQLRVPVWQRAYSWREPQWKELWGDIVRLRGQEAIATHFLGSVVVRVHPWNGSPAHAQVCSLVDGQQRVTTLTILLLAIRDSLFRLGEKEQAEALVPQLFFNEKKVESDQPRLVLQDEDQRSLRMLIERKGISSDNVGRCFEFFCNELKDEKIEDLFGLIRLIQTRLDLVWIALEATDNHHRVFQTINAGGKPLRQTDLVRNFFFLLLGGRGDDFYRDYWNTLEKLFDEKELENYFSAWSITKGYSGSNDRLFSYFNDDLSPVASSTDKVWDYGAGLVSHARLYSIILGKERDPDATVERQLQWLRQWGTKPADGLLLLLLALREKRRLSNKCLAECLAVVFSFFARRFLAGYEPNLHRSILVIIAKKLAANQTAKDDDLVEGLTVFLSEGSELKKWPSDDNVLDVTASTRLYTNARQHWVVAILGRLNHVLVDNPKLAPEPKSYKSGYQVEHILPQSMTADWQNDLKDWGVKDPAEFSQKRLHVLGNLTLTQINPELSNKRFGEKVLMVMNDSLKLNNYLKDKTEWTESRVDERTRWMVKKLLDDLPKPYSEAQISKSKFGAEARGIGNLGGDDSELEE
jgi:hypothetical protein